MRKKLKFKFEFDAPVTITFVAVSMLMFLSDTFIFKGKLGVFMKSSTAASGELPFVASNFSSYLSFILYPFCYTSWGVLLTSLVFILLLGPAMELRYGSVVIGIMMFVSAIFSGVLNACFCKTSLTGCISIVFMMFFLNSFMELSRNKIPLSFVIGFCLFILYEGFVQASGIVQIIILIAGGLCGSLLAFLTSPRAKAEKRRADYIEELDSRSPRNKKNNRNSDDDDGTTVIGTLKF